MSDSFEKRDIPSSTNSGPESAEKMSFMSVQNEEIPEKADLENRLGNEIYLLENQIANESASKEYRNKIESLYQQAVYLQENLRATEIESPEQLQVFSEQIDELLEQNTVQQQTEAPKESVPLLEQVKLAYKKSLQEMEPQIERAEESVYKHAQKLLKTQKDPRSSFTSISEANRDLYAAKLQLSQKEKEVVLTQAAHELAMDYLETGGNDQQTLKVIESASTAGELERIATELNLPAPSSLSEVAYSDSKIALEKQKFKENRDLFDDSLNNPVADPELNQSKIAIVKRFTKSGTYKTPEERQILIDHFSREVFALTESNQILEKQIAKDFNSADKILKQYGSMKDVPKDKRDDVENRLVSFHGLLLAHYSASAKIKNFDHLFNKLDYSFIDTNSQTINDKNLEGISGAMQKIADFFGEEDVFVPQNPESEDYFPDTMDQMLVEQGNVFQERINTLCSVNAKHAKKIEDSVRALRQLKEPKFMLRLFEKSVNNYREFVSSLEEGREDLKKIKGDLETELKNRNLFLNDPTMDKLRRRALSDKIVQIETILNRQNSPFSTTGIEKNKHDLEVLEKKYKEFVNKKTAELASLLVVTGVSLGAASGAALGTTMLLNSLRVSHVAVQAITVPAVSGFSSAVAGRLATEATNYAGLTDKRVNWSARGIVADSAVNAVVAALPAAKILGSGAKHIPQTRNPELYFSAASLKVFNSSGNAVKGLGVDEMAQNISGKSIPINVADLKKGKTYSEDIEERIKNSRQLLVNIEETQASPIYGQDGLIAQNFEIPEEETTQEKKKKS